MNWYAIRLLLFLVFESIFEMVYPLFLFFIKAKEGYTNLTGIDYSAASVALAKDVLQAEDLNNISVKVSSAPISLSYNYSLDINNS